MEGTPELPPGLYTADEIRRWALTKKLPDNHLDRLTVLRDRIQILSMIEDREKRVRFAESCTSVIDGIAHEVLHG